MLTDRMVQGVTRNSRLGFVYANVLAVGRTGFRHAENITDFSECEIKKNETEAYYQK